MRLRRPLTVEYVLGSVEPYRNKCFHCIRGATDLNLNVLTRAGRDVAEQKIGWILAAGWTANADAYPIEIPCTEGGPDRPQAVVTVVPAAELEPQLAYIDIELIVHNDHLRGLELVVGKQPRNRPASLVHEGA